MAVKCPFCSDLRIIPVSRQDVVNHLVVTIDKDFHFHIHGPIQEKELMRKIILNIAMEAKIDIEDESSKKNEAGHEIIKTFSPEKDRYHDTQEKGSSEGCKIYED